MEYNNKVIEVIKLLLEGYKHSEGKHDRFLSDTVNGKEYCLWDCDYLLNQVIRHYDVPWDRYYYSEGFIRLWTELGMDKNSRRDFHFHEIVTCQNDNVRCLLYKGASSKASNNDGEYLNKGDTFPFRDAFHKEHIVPISHIIDELVKLENPTDDQIENILNKICVARITKEEDRKMHNKNNRPSTFEEVYNTLYRDNGIKLIRESDDKVIEYTDNKGE